MLCILSILSWFVANSVVSLGQGSRILGSHGHGGVPAAAAPLAGAHLEEQLEAGRDACPGYHFMRPSLP